jgi:D-lactate dehydrogenase
MARQPAGSPLLAKLLEEYEYDGLETCAADGTCADACPLGIDTGKLVKELRASEHTPREEAVALRVAKRWAKVERSSRAGLRIGHAIADAVGDGPLEGASAAARRVVSSELVPEWEPPMPPPASPGMPPTLRAGAAAVYLPACVNRIFGRSGTDPDGPASLPAALVAVSLRAGRPVWIPGDVTGTCCSLPWSSKGYRDGSAAMATATIEDLWRWSDGGELPVVIDASSCTHGLLEAAAGLGDRVRERLEALTILDSIEWAGRHLLTHLDISGKVGTVVIHPTCSSKHLGLDGELALLANAMADQVVVPETATCCGFAGDRGFLHPELTASATTEEAREVSAAAGDAHICANRTCEIGMERATGERYESFVYLLERLTRPAAEATA